MCDRQFMVSWCVLAARAAWRTRGVFPRLETLQLVIWGKASHTHQRVQAGCQAVALKDPSAIPSL